MMRGDVSEKKCHIFLEWGPSSSSPRFLTCKCFWLTSIPFRSHPEAPRWAHRVWPRSAHPAASVVSRQQQRPWPRRPRRTRPRHWPTASTRWPASTRRTWCSRFITISLLSRICRSRKVRFGAFSNDVTIICNIFDKTPSNCHASMADIVKLRLAGCMRPFDLSVICHRPNLILVQQ